MIYVHLGKGHIDHTCTFEVRIETAVPGTWVSLLVITL